MSASAGLIAILLLFPLYLVYTGKIGTYLSYAGASNVNNDSKSNVTNS